MINVHIVTSLFPPGRGGLERWTLDLASSLASGGFRPIIYVLGEEAVAQHDREHSLEIVDIAPLRTPWEDPLKKSNWKPHLFVEERSRLDFACVRAEVMKRTRPGSNVILSNFITTAGFTAHLVAEALDLPHVPVLAGTDFSRGFHTKRDRQIILEVCRFARIVVCKSAEQFRAIRRYVSDATYKVIETSIKTPTRRWHRKTVGGIVIFSDGGFSFKKGTGVLMDAFVALLAKGISARLVICGGDQAGQENYWIARRRVLESETPLSVTFPGFLSQAEIVDHICSSDFYASATLGEGASAARALALCLGTPIVTTACGELAADPEACHVRLVPVGDAAAFRDATFALASDLLAGAVTIDDNAVDRFRRRFDPQIEWTSWFSLLREAALGT